MCLVGLKFPERYAQQAKNWVPWKASAGGEKNKLTLSLLGPYIDPSGRIGTFPPVNSEILCDHKNTSHWKVTFVLFAVMYKASIVSLRLWMKSYIVSIVCKAAEQYFLVVLGGFMIFRNKLMKQYLTYTS